MGETFNVVSGQRQAIEDQSELAALRAENERLKVHHARERATRLRYGKALNQIACYFDGDEIDGSFDEPGSARIARTALEE
jgi:hypothetical protein